MLILVLGIKKFNYISIFKKQKNLFPILTLTPSRAEGALDSKSVVVAMHAATERARMCGG
jgi:hypothetical protein